MNSEGDFHSGGAERQIEGIKKMRENEGMEQIRTTLPRSLKTEDKSKMT